MYSINFLPARYGDCIWIQYGDKQNPNNILIDGGTGGTKAEIKKNIEQIPEDQRHFELMVVTHVDRDHIEGMLRLLEDDELNFTVSDFWFNGYKHLLSTPYEAFGAEMGEDLSKRIIKHDIPWNDAFGNAAVVIENKESLPTFILGGGMSLTLLSPYREHLDALKPKWAAEILRAGMKPGYGSEDDRQDVESFGVAAMPDIESLNKTSHEEDDSVANGSSIAFIASYKNKNVIFAGDAFPGTILESLTTLYGDQNVPISLMKLSHHASSHNTSPELIEKLDCRKFMISTNGAIYKHPSKETIAWIIKRAKNPSLYFNYKTEHNNMWDNELLKTRFGYVTHYPEEQGMQIKL